MIESSTSEIDSVAFRHVLKHYPTGVCVVTARDLDGPIGITIGSFTSVSLQPPLVGFFIDRNSTSWLRMQESGNFCVNVLSSSQGDLCRRFSAPGRDRFAGLSHGQSANGSPILDAVIAWIDCRLHAVHPAGDHWIVLGQVQELNLVRAEQPLLFFRGQFGNFVALSAAP